MAFLIITLLLNICISVFFRLAPSWRLDRLHVVVANYWVCSATGLLVSGGKSFAGGTLPEWMPWSCLTGIGFFGVFSVLAASTALLGISKTVVANKLSIVIPVTCAVWFNGDHLGAIKIVGMLLSLPAVLLVSGIGTGADKVDKTGVAMLGALFVGGGLLDAMLNHVSSHSPDVANPPTFTTWSFGFAAVIGTGMLIYRMARRETVPNSKNLLAGVVLGIPNFFSIYCYIKMLHSPFLQPSASIPVMNIAILACSAIVGGLFFKELADRKRVLGIVLAVIAVLTISWGDKL
jgi:multidrug transporter EmrE-like cation transporter